MQSLILRVKRGQGPFYGKAKTFVKRALAFQLPVPRVLRPLLRSCYYAHFTAWHAGRWVLNVFYRGPLFRARCEHVGRNFAMTLLPDAQAHTRIWIGDNVSLYGKVGIASSRLAPDPKLIIEDRVGIGHKVQIAVNSEVVIGAGTLIAQNVRISDNDGHPLDPEARAARKPASEARPVRIGKDVWIGNSAIILKGVTIGDGAVIAAASVVTRDVPPYTVAAGNPTRVLKTLRTNGDRVSR